MISLHYVIVMLLIMHCFAVHYKAVFIMIAYRAIQSTDLCGSEVTVKVKGFSWM